ncbi:HOOK protein-domain-containing protein [Lipomyces arxii]|uniref:HOOK protein-domain-containing protein n=1 Tax=Lipomyces arxii TaxID=56418 RepID=UPI0034CE8821
MASLLQRSLVEWANSLPFHLSIHSIESVTDLSDGISLSKVLLDIDSEYFKQTAISADDEKPSFIAATRNLKRLFKSLTAYATDVLGLPPLEESETPNISLIAKDNSVDDTVKFASVVVRVAAKALGSKGAEYLDGIKHVYDSELRTTLLDLVGEGEQVMVDAQSSLTQDSQGDDGSQTIAIAQYDELQHSYHELLETNTALTTDTEKLKKQNSELQAQLANSTGQSKAEIDVEREKSKSEIDFLQKEVQDLEDQLAERDRKLIDSDTKLTDLMSKIDDLHTELDNTVELNDRLDESKFEITRLRKIANQIDKYKREADEAELVKQQLEAARNEITYLNEKSKLLDEDSQQVFGLRRQVDVLTSEIEFFKRKAKETEEAAEHARQELAYVRDRVLVLEEDHTRDLDVIAGLEEKVFELEGGAVKNAIGSLQDQDLVATVSDLKLEIRRLQDQVVAERMGDGNVDKTAVVEDSKVSAALETELRETLDQKQRLQDDYLQVYQEKLVLQSQVDAIEDGALGETSDVMMQLRGLLQQTKDELQDAKHQIADLSRQLTSQNERLQLMQDDLDLVDEDKKDAIVNLRKSVSHRVVQLQQQNDTLTASMQDLETDNKKQLELLSKALIEKESLYQKLTASHEELLEVSRANTALRMSLVSLDPNAGGYESELKSWVIDLQKRVEAQRDKLKKAQEFIRQLRAENESHRQRAASEETARKNMISVQEATNIKRELGLMISAWYSLTARIQQNNVVVVKQVQESPESWLNRQRTMLEKKN